MEDLNKNIGKSREEKSVNTTNVYFHGENRVDSQDLPVFRAMNSAKQEMTNGYSNGSNGNHVNTKSNYSNGNGKMNGNSSIAENENHTTSMNGNGSLNGKSTLNGNGSLNGKSALNGNSSLNGKSTLNGKSSMNGNGLLNGNGQQKTNGADVHEINGNGIVDNNEEHSEVFKGIKYLNNDDQSFTFTIESPIYVVLIVTNRLTMREEILVNDELAAGDYIVKLNKDIVLPGFHYYKLYYEADEMTPDAYRFNDIKPEMKFYLKTIKEVTVL